MRFGIHEQKIIAGMLPKFAELRIKDPHVRIVSLTALKRTFTTKELKFIKNFLLINPYLYCFRGEHYGLSQVPKDLVTIKKESAPGSGKVVTRGVHYLPKDVHSAYQGMNRVMLRDIGRRVFVESGYRSPAYQCILFIEYLVEDDFDITKTVKRIAFPGYSEHGAPHTQAIDFITEDREDNSTVNPIFEKTKEYRWLSAHAVEYGFALSYPRGNKLGVAFEPWHWHYNAQIL
jgi:LAS superfamily LD-carboxypeptidase LdcB